MIASSAKHGIDGCILSVKHPGDNLSPGGNINGNYFLMHHSSKDDWSFPYIIETFSYIIENFDVFSYMCQKLNLKRKPNKFSSIHYLPK